jgi:hypothetical protein
LTTNIKRLAKHYEQARGDERRILRWLLDRLYSPASAADTPAESVTISLVFARHAALLRTLTREQTQTLSALEN